MILYHITDDTGLILATGGEKQKDVLREIGETWLARYSYLYPCGIALHSGMFADGNEPKVGMTSSMRGDIEWLR